MKKRNSFCNFTKLLIAFFILLLSLQLLPNESKSVQAADALQFTYSASTWFNGYNLNITIKNTTNSTIDGWTLTLNKSDFQINNIWCASKTSSGNSIIITPESWNKTIAAGRSVTLGFTGTGTFKDGFSYTLSSGSGSVVIPTIAPTSRPTVAPTVKPTTAPTTRPTTAPTTRPTSMPTVAPTYKPTTAPTSTPSFQVQVPSFSSLGSNSKLPNPFEFKTGSLKGTKMTSKSQWANRRQEISALAQAFEFGVKPETPKNVQGSFNGNSITVTVTENGKSISFKCSIQYPSTGTAPYPAMIGVNMNTLNTSEILKLGVACITFPADEIGAEVNASSRGQGKFFNIYGSNYDAGALIAWAWGVDCLIDALENTPAAKINPARLGVTGGSRNGKGALAIGAFCDRIALTVPQESGNGGASGWRTADALKATGQNVQTLSQIITENCWFSRSFNQFNGNTNKLPYDHHEVLALCAPRGLLVIENPDFTWLGNESCFNTTYAARMIYEALGVRNNIGYSSIGGHGHCVFPSSQQPELTAYIKRFLLDQNADTNIWRSDRNYTFNSSKWTDWTVPTLQ